MKVDGITLLQMILDRKIKDKTKFKASRDNAEIPFLEKNRVLHTDGHGLYNELGEAPTIDLILNYKFKIIEEDKPIEKVKEIRELIEVSFSKLEEAQDKINRLENELEKRLDK